MKIDTPESAIATTDQVLEQMFASKNDYISDFRQQNEIADALVKDLKFQYVESRDKTERIRIDPKNMRRILDLTFREQQVKLVRATKETSSPRFESFEGRKERLKRAYALEILEVVPKSEESDGKDADKEAGKEAGKGTGMASLAEHAASLFVRIISEQTGVPTVGVGGGQTLRWMSLYVDLREVKPFISAPLNFVTRVPEAQIFDSNAQSKFIFRTAGKGASPGFGIPPTPTDSTQDALNWHRMLFDANNEIRNAFHACVNPDVIFVGAGNFYEKSEAITKLTAYLGMDHEFLSGMTPPPIGDINFCFFDSEGQDITGKLLERMTAKLGKPVSTFFPDEPWCHPFFVGLNMARMKQMVEEQKPVVVVAGCDAGAKAHCLAALMKAKVINGLVTDSTTMDALLSFVE
jgi:DNA-binding transcriptional regulator LsrR (DeoR family)